MPHVLKSRSKRKQPSSIPRAPIYNEANFSLKVRKFTGFTNVNSTVATATLFGTSFHLDELVEYTSMTDLFDQYRFDSVEVHIISLNQPPLSTVTATSCPALEIAIDYDDSSAPASLGALRNYQNLQVLPLGRSKKFKFVPHSTTYEYDGTSSVPSGNRRLVWHDCAQTSIRHYGLKWGFASQPQISTFQFWYTYTFSFRNAR